MLNLALAATAFFVLHRLISGTSIREMIAGRIGENSYRRPFALALFLCLAWLWLGYAEARSSASSSRLFTSSTEPHPVQLPLQLAAIVLITAGLTTRNPMIAGLGHAIQQPDVVRGVLRITRHPFLWGVAILAAGHMLILSDAASWGFFGTLLVLALTGTLSIDLKRQRVWGRAWEEFAARTSNLPSGAILGGRQSLNLREIGWWRFLGALAGHAFFVATHRHIFGGSVMPRDLTHVIGRTLRLPRLSGNCCSSTSWNARAPPVATIFTRRGPS